MDSFLAEDPSCLKDSDSGVYPTVQFHPPPFDFILLRASSSIPGWERRQNGVSRDYSSIP